MKAFLSPFRESRECGRVSAAPQPTSGESDPYIRRFELDRRGTAEHQHAQWNFLRKTAGYGRWSMGRLFGFDTTAKEGRIQAKESRFGIGEYKEEANVRAWLLSTNSKEFKDEMGKVFKKTRRLHFRAAGTGAVDQTLSDVDITVDLKNAAWRDASSLTQDRIVSRITAMRGMADLRAIGITFTDGRLHHFTNEQAKEIAKFIMVRNSRGNLATGMVGEVNVRMAQKMLLDHPEDVKKLEGDHGHAEAELKKAEGKKTLSEQLEHLRKREAKSFAEDFQQANTLIVQSQAEYKDLENQRRLLADDRANLRGGPTAPAAALPGAAPGTTVPAGGLTLPPNSVVPQGLVIPAATAVPAGGIFLPPGTVLPGGATSVPPGAAATVVGAAGLTLNAGVILIGGATIPSGTVLPTGIALPQGTVLPGGATTAGTNPSNYTFASAFLGRQGYIDSNQINLLPQERDRRDIQNDIAAEITRLETEKSRVSTEQKRLQDVVDYYQKLTNELEQVYAQISRAGFSVGPAAFTSLFEATGTPRRIDRARMNSTVNPIALADAIAEHCGKLGKPEDFNDEIEKAKEHAKEAKDDKVVGARSVIEIFKTNFMRKEEVGVDEAQTRAFQTFFKNELSLSENRQIEQEIDHLFNRQLTLTRGTINGALSAGKALIKGSDEIYICKIAEQVGVPPGAGTGATKWRHKILEGAEWTGAGAGVGAALGASGILTSLPVSGLATATAIGAAPLALAAAGTLGAFVCGYRALKSRFLGRRLGWAAGALGSGATGAIAGLATYTGLALPYGYSIPTLTSLGVGLGTSFAIPPVALAAAAGVGAYSAFKFFGLDRKMFGSRQLAYLWPRWGARPAWGAIAHDRLALKIAWDSMVKGVKEGKLSNTWYVRNQMQELGRLLLGTMAEEMGEEVGAQMKIDPKQWKFFSMDNKRAQLQRQISELFTVGAAGVGGKVRPGIAEGAKYVEGEATKSRGGWRRGLWNAFGKDGAMTKWLNEKR